MVTLPSLEEAVRDFMRSIYMAFWGPLPVMIAKIGGRGLLKVDEE